MLTEGCREAISAIQAKANHLQQQNGGKPLSQCEIDSLLLELGAPTLDLPMYLVSFLQMIAPMSVSPHAKSSPRLPLGLEPAGCASSVQIDHRRDGSDAKDASQHDTVEVVDIRDEDDCELDDDDDDVVQLPSKPSVPVPRASELAAKASDGKPPGLPAPGATVGRREDGVEFIRIAAYPFYSGCAVVGGGGLILPSLDSAKSLDPTAVQYELVREEEYASLLRHYHFPSALGPTLLSSEADDSSNTAKSDACADDVMIVDEDEDDGKQGNPKRSLQAAILQQMWRICAPIVDVYDGPMMDALQVVGLAHGRCASMREASLGNKPAPIDDVLGCLLDANSPFS